MGRPEWTEEQKQVIELRDRNILVSAAAGSGKTAVLVERIITEITEGDSPKDIDKLLVVTFTKAAAAEMRARIGDALEERLRLEPENQHIQKQASLLHTAQITTIDSFCQSVIKNYFHVIHLDPSFRVGDETDLEIMKQELLGELLEKKYQKAHEEGQNGFLRFTDMLSVGRTDHAIEEMVLSLDRLATSYPWKEEWLEKCGTLYDARTLEELEQTEWMRELFQYLEKCMEEYLQMARSALKICQEGDGPQAYQDAILSDIAFLEEMQGAENYQSYYQELEKYNPAKLKAIRSKDVNSEKKEFVKNLRETYLKKGIEKLKERFFFQNPEEMLLDMQEMASAVRELVSLTLEFGRVFAEKKREEGILDFADMEHFALEILVTKEEDGTIYPSETALELQDYYEEILTDEYQDSNYIQELLLTSLCRAPKKKPYLFMVGDVKQSIYKFRLARPELFLEKYQKYTVGKGPFQKIDLHRNFRSRENVLESANYIFEQIMQESLGGIIYDEAAKLVPGASFGESEEDLEKAGDCEKRVAGKTEVVVIEQKSEDVFLQKKSLEATVIGEKIKGMVQGESPLYVKGKNGFRPVEYRDIAILLRSLTGWSEEFIEVLNDMGVPAYADTKTGYFTSLEVETVLNLLHIIDNPRQDIPLVAVLRSNLCNITDEELAWIGTMPEGLDFWDKVQELVNGDTEDGIFLTLSEKLSDFIEKLENYRQFAKLHSVYELLRKIYYETGYYNLMSAMPSGEKRRANLDILLQQSIEFAQNGHLGTYGFTRYIENLKKSQVDFGEASVNGENTNAVRIMTIHKSKGLEFPIVFVAGMGKQFNLMDARKGTIIDGDYGIGCDYVNLDLRIKQPTLLKRLMANQITLGTLAEEIRILYVALTRAKEQIIITGTSSGLRKKLEGWITKSEFLNFSQLSGAQTYLDWIMPAILKRDGLNTVFREYLSAGDERELFSSLDRDSLFTAEFCFPENVLQSEKKSLENDVLQYRRLKQWDTEKVYDKSLRETLERQLAYRYPYSSAAFLPVKLSVSELKRQFIQRAEQMEEGEQGYQTLYRKEEIQDMSSTVKKVQNILSLENEKEEIEIPRPSFLQKEKKLSGITRGTLYHLVMEHFPYDRIAEGNITVEKFREYLGEMVKKGYLREEEVEFLDAKKFVAFIHTNIGKRMQKAELEGKLHREQPFMLGLKANEIYEGQAEEEMVMVQGIIDAFFFDGEEIILVDYKTDLVGKGQEKKLVEKYQVQLDYYARALERMTGRKVSERIIYSFALGKELRC